LALHGALNAGSAPGSLALGPHSAVRVTTGAPLPVGADAVLPEELCTYSGEELDCRAAAAPGRNVLCRGSDVLEGEALARAGARLSPPLLGLLAAGGVALAPVGVRPRVAIVATGDEIVLPGSPLGPGRLYASNLVTLAAWLEAFGFETSTALVPDQSPLIRRAFTDALLCADVLLTSGGIWMSERDLLRSVLEELGAELVYHGVRLGPGKGVALALLDPGDGRARPVFCLPGGPPSNEMAFLKLALPGLLAMEGDARPPFAIVRARLARAIDSQPDWTEVHQARLQRTAAGFEIEAQKRASRLRSMAERDALLTIPEGVARLEAGAEVEVELTVPPGRG